MIKYIELFAGIGGFRSGLDRLGMECVFSSEIDKYATLSYKTLYGNHQLHGDITKINTCDIPEHDLLVGGFPCQAFSIAGKRKGFEDTRGTLFFEIARIAKDKKPKMLFLENVRGLISHDKRNTFKTMCLVLSEIGYCLDFKLLNSKNFGVPQNRERIFIVASRDAKSEDWIIEGTTTDMRAKQEMTKLGVKSFNFKFPENKNNNSKLKDILEDIVDEKYFLTKEKQNDLTYPIHCLNHSIIDGIPINENTKKGYDIAKDGDCVNLGYAKSNKQRGRVGHEIANTILASTSANIGTVIRNKIRKLTPLECFRLQGFTDSQFYKLVQAKIPETQLYKQAGNAVTVNVIYEIGKEIKKHL